MKITKKQQEEIDFLKKVFLLSTSKEEELEYIEHTVLGQGEKYKNMGENNKLLLAKRQLDINIKMWREDLTRGLIGVQELKSDFNCPYGDRLVDSIIKSVTKEYRKKTLDKDGVFTVLGFTNFPEAMKNLNK